MAECLPYTTWKYNGVYRGYLLNYDNLNRLIEGFATNSEHEYGFGNSEGFSYDKMGNITYLWRADVYETDNLSFSYNGNQIQWIVDDAGNQNLYNLKEYIERNNSMEDPQTEFFYDANGNMTTDLDREIVTIKYNLLNLPELIQFKNGCQIKNTYSADGQKLSSRYITVNAGVYQPLNPGQVIDNLDVNENDNVTVEGTDYIGNIEYSIYRYFDWDVTFEPAELKYLYRVHNPEGYATSVTTYGPVYYYNRKDHLGNNREVWRASYTWGSTTYAAGTSQRTQYYPSGLPWKYNAGDYPETQPYKYGGKEFVEMHGFDSYDFHARILYPAIGPQFMSVDPLCELKPWQSPYMYCSGNPVNRTDPTGMIDDQVLPEITVTAKKPKSSDNNDYFFRQLLSLSNQMKSSMPQITPEVHPFSYMMNNIATTNKDTEARNSTLEDITIALSATGISADAVKIYVRNEAGKKIVYVTLKGTTAAVNIVKVISVLKGISTATIVVGIAVDLVHVAVDPDYAGKAIVNTGVTVVATIIGATLSAPAGIVIGGGYLLLDQLGAFSRPTNIPYYNRPVCPQDNTIINVPYK